MLPVLEPDQTIANIKHQTKERLRTHLLAANHAPTVFLELCDTETTASGV